METGKTHIAVILAMLLFFSMTGMTVADSKRQKKQKKPVKIPGPYAVTIEEWTEIIRSLQQRGKYLGQEREKPFRFEYQLQTEDLEER